MKKLTIMLAVAMIAAAPSVALAAKKVVHHHHRQKVEASVHYSSDMAHLLHDMVSGQ